MAKYKVKVEIKFDVEIEASSSTQAIEIINESFDVEDFIDQIQDNKKFTKATLIDIENETEDYEESQESYSDDEEDEDY